MLSQQLYNLVYPLRISNYFVERVHDMPLLNESGNVSQMKSLAEYYAYPHKIVSLYQFLGNVA